MSKEVINLSVSNCIQKNESPSMRIVVLYDNMEIKERVDPMWEQVFRYSNKVVREAAAYGVEALPDVPNLNLHGMVSQLQALSEGIKYLIDYGPKLGLSHDQNRMALNAKEQLSRMTRLSDALKADDEAAYIIAIQELEKQAEL